MSMRSQSDADMRRFESLTFDDWANLIAEVERLKGERDQARELNHRYTCAYCGYSFKAMDSVEETKTAMSDHIIDCKEHPLRNLVTVTLERDRWMQEVERLTAKLSALPADWFEDSSLETWFPLTAEQMESMKVDVERLTRERAEETERIEFLRAQVQDLVEAFEEAKGKAEKVTRERDQAQAACAEMRQVVEANHKWHQNYDEYEGYPDSELCELNCHVLGLSVGAPLLARLERQSFELSLCRSALRECVLFKGGNLPAEMVRRGEKALAACESEPCP